MQRILKEPARNLESILLRAVNDSELSNLRLFEKFQNEILLQDAETEAKPDVNLNELLMFPKPNEILAEDLTIPAVDQNKTSEDKLFLFYFDTSSTENQEEISLAGIDQLPAVSDDQLRKILSREDVTNPIDPLAELHIQDLKFTSEKR